MRVFRAVVQISALPVFDLGKQLAVGIVTSTHFVTNSRKLLTSETARTLKKFPFKPEARKKIALRRARSS
jgi:hypothetical protein